MQDTTDRILFANQKVVAKVPKALLKDFRAALGRHLRYLRWSHSGGTVPCMLLASHPGVVLGAWAVPTSLVCKAMLVKHTFGLVCRAGGHCLCRTCRQAKTLVPWRRTTCGVQGTLRQAQRRPWQRRWWSSLPNQSRPHLPRCQKMGQGPELGQGQELAPMQRVRRMTAALSPECLIKVLVVVAFRGVGGVGAHRCGRRRCRRVPPVAKLPKVDQGVVILSRVMDAMRSRTCAATVACRLWSLSVSRTPRRLLVSVVLGSSAEEMAHIAERQMQSQNLRKRVLEKAQMKVYGRYVWDCWWAKGRMGGQGATVHSTHVACGRGTQDVHTCRAGCAKAKTNQGLSSQVWQGMCARPPPWGTTVLTSHTL